MRCLSWSTSGGTIPLAAIAAAAGTPVPESPSELADVLAERSAQIGGEIYLVLDQMEEYFVYHGRDAGGPLREALAEILTRPTLRVHVLLGIRDDALADLDAFKGRVPGLFGNVLRLDHLDVDSARAAIVEPLAELEAMGGPHWWPSRHSWRRSWTRSRRAGSNGGSRAAGSSRAPRRGPRRSAVPAARDGATLGGRAQHGLLRFCTRRPSLSSAARVGSSRNTSSARSAALDEPERDARGAALPSARHAIGNEDRARGRRSQPLRRRVPGAARGRAACALETSAGPRAPRP